MDGVESGLIDGKIVLLVASREGIGALERAKKHGIDSAVFDKKKFASDEEMFSAIGRRACSTRNGADCARGLS